MDNLTFARMQVGEWRRLLESSKGDPILEQQAECKLREWTERLRLLESRKRKHRANP